MTTAINETGAGSPPTVTVPRGVSVPCSHCGGSGKEPDVVIPAGWQDVYLRLQAAGKRRAEFSSARGIDGLQRLHEAWDEIRDIWENQARPIGMTQRAAAAAVGVGRMQFSTGIRGHIGGKRIESARTP